MPALAITGTIGSGKSSAVLSLGSLLQAEIFSADKENRRLLDEDTEVKALIIASLGSCCYQEDGTADRKKIFDLILPDEERRAALEGILHPRLQQLWKPRAEHYRKNKTAFFIAEIPLLFEKNLEFFFDKTIVVGCSDSIRTTRLQKSRSVTAAQAEAWFSLQEPQETKALKADYLLWNDGPPTSLQQQIQTLTAHLLQS